MVTKGSMITSGPELALLFINMFISDNEIAQSYVPQVIEHLAES